MCRACPMLSANTVAQKPAGSVIPPLSLGHAADAAVAESDAVLSAPGLSDLTHPPNASIEAIATNEDATRIDSRIGFFLPYFISFSPSLAFRWHPAAAHGAEIDHQGNHESRNRPESPMASKPVVDRRIPEQGRRQKHEADDRPENVVEDTPEPV